MPRSSTATGMNKGLAPDKINPVPTDRWLWRLKRIVSPGRHSALTAATKPALLFTVRKCGQPEKRRGQLLGRAINREGKEVVQAGRFGQIALPSIRQRLGEAHETRHPLFEQSLVERIFALDIFFPLRKTAGWSLRLA